MKQIHGHFYKHKEEIKKILLTLQYCNIPGDHHV